MRSLPVGHPAAGWPRWPDRQPSLPPPHRSATSPTLAAATPPCPRRFLAVTPVRARSYRSHRRNPPRARPCLPSAATPNPPADRTNSEAPRRLTTHPLPAIADASILPSQIAHTTFPATDPFLQWPALPCSS